MCWVSQVCRVDGQGRYMKVGDFISCHPPFKGKKSRYTTSNPFKFSWTKIFFNGFCCSSWCAVFFSWLQAPAGLRVEETYSSTSIFVPKKQGTMDAPNAINFVAALILIPWVGEIGILHDRNHHWLHHLNRFLVKAPWWLGCGTLAKFCSKWMWLITRCQRPYAWMGMGQIDCPQGMDRLNFQQVCGCPKVYPYMAGDLEVIQVLGRIALVCHTRDKRWGGSLMSTSWSAHRAAMDEGKENESHVAFSQRAMRKPRPTLFGFARSRGHHVCHRRRIDARDFLKLWSAGLLTPRPQLLAWMLQQPNLHALPHRWKQKNSSSWMS